MNKVFILLILLFVFDSEANDYIRSLNASLSKVSSDTNLSNRDKNKALTFVPNVTTGFGVGLEAKYLTLAYVFSGSDADRKELPRSEFQDIRFNFNIWQLDFRLNFQRYRGAYVDAAKTVTYYNDYEVRSRNLRAHYYFMPEILKFVRDGKDLTQMAASNQGTRYFASPFAGFALDSRSLKLPQALAAAHQAEVVNKGIHYSRNFDALTLGPLLGCDFVVLKGPIFFRIKAGGGAGFQVGGRVVELIELALSLGVGFSMNHSIAIGVDSYTTSFRDNSKVVENSNTQGGITYNYAFW